MIKKNEKGITLITLVITIVILATITITLATNAYDSTQLSRLTKLDNDIKTLNDRVAVYFVEHEQLPTHGNSYSKEKLKDVIEGLSQNDGDKYYTIDLSLLDNLSLNYGQDYLSFGGNSYIINEESHIIYHLEGISYKGEIFHTVGANSTVILNY